MTDKEKFDTIVFNLNCNDSCTATNNAKIQLLKYEESIRVPVAVPYESLSGEIVFHLNPKIDYNYLEMIRSFKRSLTITRIDLADVFDHGDRSLYSASSDGNDREKIIFVSRDHSGNVKDTIIMNSRDCDILWYALIAMISYKLYLRHINLPQHHQTSSRTSSPVKRKLCC